MDNVYVARGISCVYVYLHQSKVPTCLCKLLVHDEMLQYCTCAKYRYICITRLPALGPVQESPWSMQGIWKDFLYSLASGSGDTADWECCFQLNLSSAHPGIQTSGIRGLCSRISPLSPGVSSQWHTDPSATYGYTSDRRETIVDSTLDQRQRRWSSVESTLILRPIFICLEIHTTGSVIMHPWSLISANEERLWERENELRCAAIVS